MTNRELAILLQVNKLHSYSKLLRQTPLHDTRECAELLAARDWTTAEGQRYA